MIDGTWVYIKRGTTYVLGWIEKNTSFLSKDETYQTYYFHTLDLNRSKEPILIYQKDIHSAEVKLEDEDYHHLQHVALSSNDLNWFTSLGVKRY